MNRDTTIAQRCGSGWCVVLRLAKPLRPLQVKLRGLRARRLGVFGNEEAVGVQDLHPRLLHALSRPKENLHGVAAVVAHRHGAALRGQDGELAGGQLRAAHVHLAWKIGIGDERKGAAGGQLLHGQRPAGLDPAHHHVDADGRGQLGAGLGVPLEQALLRHVPGLHLPAVQQLGRHVVGVVAARRVVAVGLRDEPGQLAHARLGVGRGVLVVARAAPRVCGQHPGPAPGAHNQVLTLRMA
mmetsp:Transcript_32689/g.84734  ORF Transcript_32689/g.84734 Transcript_32689/m.84734 type:complete len:240 (+) Transcript_32689:73-792(+)